jgi:2-polyprenyl-6-methoxyphenol hydroxylase-like FAD-dependent oxidoreductase
LADRGAAVDVRFEDGDEATFSLVFGADGVHSRVRELAFGAESRFERFLGGYVAAFHLAGHDYGVGRALKLYEEIDRVVWLYPLDDRIPRIDATYVFRHPKVDVPREMRLAFIREQFEGAGWVAERVLRDYPHADPIFFDSLTQIVMPRWHEGRIALLGDACGCLTLLAGQGSHMAMAGAYVLANELEKHQGNHDSAFAAYESALKDSVARKQKEAARFAAYIMPTKESRPWLRHFVMRLLFSPLGMGLAFRFLGGKSALSGYS